MQEKISGSLSCWSCGQKTETSSRFLRSLAVSSPQGKGDDATSIGGRNRHSPTDDFVLGTHGAACRAQTDFCAGESIQGFSLGIITGKALANLCLSCFLWCCNFAGCAFFLLRIRRKQFFSSLQSFCPFVLKKFVFLNICSVSNLWTTHFHRLKVREFGQMSIQSVRRNASAKTKP